MFISIACLALVAIFVTWRVFLAQERMAESILMPYVSDMVRDISFNLKSHQNHHEKDDIYSGHHFMISGPSLSGGLLLIVSKEGDVIASSPGAMPLRDVFLQTPAQGSDGYKIIAHDRKDYIMIWNTVEADEKILFLIPWETVFAPAALASRGLACVLLLLFIGLLGLIWALWRTVIAPIRRMVLKVRSLRWGSEPLDTRETFCVWEVGVLESSLSSQAQKAIENEHLKEQYISDVIDAQEKERERFSRELHDGPLQFVTAAIRRIQIASALWKGTECNSPDLTDVKENLAEAEKAAQFSADEIRDLCDELSPSWLELGLSNALTELAERMTRRGEANIRLNLPENAQALEIPREKELALLRIFQEAYSNSALHGQARNIDVELAVNEDSVILKIRDDGKGFDASWLDKKTLRAKGHRGISNMMERIALAGGDIGIISRPGDGCLVQAKIAI
jgi:signal transduction histidine kinase